MTSNILGIFKTVKGKAVIRLKKRNKKNLKNTMEHKLNSNKRQDRQTQLLIYILLVRIA